MKKMPFNFRYGLKLFISASAMASLLTSCCIPLNLPSSKKPCNCKDEIKTIYAVKNKSVLQPDGGTATFSLALNSSAEQSKNYQALVMEEPVAAINPSNAPMKEAFHVGQLFQDIAEANANEAGHEFKPGDLFIPDGQNAHKTSETKLPFGIKRVSTSIIAAPNISFKSSKEDYGNTKHKHKPGIGFLLGVGTTYTFTDKVAVSTSLLVKKNSASEVLTYSPGEPGGNPMQQEYESKYSFTYLSVPILAQYKLSDQFTATAGPEINYLLGASVKSGGSGDNDKTSITKNAARVGAGFQLGLKYSIPGSPLDVQLTYDHRLSRLNKKSGSDYYPGGSYDTPAWNMKSVQLGVTCAICQLLHKNR